ncbi:MAG: hypothetical protein UU12_C0041G0009 [Candidatus Woesebacteria bacterium GW2011_GWA2_40_7b]|uniref:Uncharacterized protein n=1 Tax=Candidatus Woesebacteria bacterium GW2011_GWA2_40_7b TaxID=1618563 RepID=A0A0G0SXT7_9BACT|nr:MAG: hypothetical protein UU12_C0041G0009 [Candidatus Woesebacteria bacterium GW2011_GWA2_40_7b]
MRLVIQRVKKARVTRVADKKIAGQIETRRLVPKNYTVMDQRL